MSSFNGRYRNSEKEGHRSTKRADQVIPGDILGIIDKNFQRE